MEKTISVYRIRHVDSGKYYVGSSQETEKRFARHLIDLRRGTHYSPHLQRAWSKYGEERFVIEIVDVFLTVEEARYAEQRILDEEKVLLYNTSKKASGGDLLSYHPRRSEIIEKIKEGLRLRNSTLTPKERAERWSKPGELNGMFGRKHTEEARAKMRGPRPELAEKMRNRIVSNETRKKQSLLASQRIGELNPFHGRTHSESTRELIRSKSEEQRALGPLPRTQGY